MRVCFFGDSFVNGTGDDDGLGWVGRVVTRARQGGRDLTGYNLGIRRDTSADVAARWQAEAERRLPAEHHGRLVFSFGTNDCMSTSVDERPRVSHADSLSSAENILKAASSWLPTLMIGPCSVAGAPDANDRICALSADYATLCQRFGAPYLEVCRLTLASPLWTDEAIAGDGAHPNRGGYMLLADAVSNWAPWLAWMEGAP
jgi:lysophospholipase L1-like esterase